MVWGWMMDDGIDLSAHYPIEEVAALKGVPYATVRSAIVRGERKQTSRSKTVMGECCRTRPVPDSASVQTSCSNLGLLSISPPHVSPYYEEQGKRAGSDSAMWEDG